MWSLSASLVDKKGKKMFVVDLNGSLSALWGVVVVVGGVFQLWLKSPRRMNIFLSADQAKGKEQKCFDISRCLTQFRSLFFFLKCFKGSLNAC